MNKILFLCILLVTLNFSISADENRCYKQICIDDQVMDQYGWRGIVSHFDLQNEMILVKMSHIPSIFPFPYQDLGVRVNCFDGFCTNDKVIDRYGDSGTIFEIYNNKMVRFLDDTLQEIYIYKSTELTHQIPHCL